MELGRLLYELARVVADIKEHEHNAEKAHSELSDALELLEDALEGLNELEERG